MVAGLRIHSLLILRRSDEIQARWCQPWIWRPASILRGAVLPTTNGTDSGEECEMSATGEISEPASELERLIADLPGSGLAGLRLRRRLVVAHLDGVTTHLFRGPTDRRWWHVELGDDATRWTMDVRVDEITGVRFGRGPYPFPRSLGGRS